MTRPKAGHCGVQVKLGSTISQALGLRRRARVACDGCLGRPLGRLWTLFRDADGNDARSSGKACRGRASKIEIVYFYVCKGMLCMLGKPERSLSTIIRHQQGWWFEILMCYIKRPPPSALSHAHERCTLWRYPSGGVESFPMGTTRDAHFMVILFPSITKQIPMLQCSQIRNSCFFAFSSSHVFCSKHGDCHCARGAARVDSQASNIWYFGEYQSHNMAFNLGE